MNSHRCVVSALVLTATLFPRPARAIEPGSAAGILFAEGRKLAENGDYRSACPKFEQSLALEVGVGTQFNLADCWEHIGRTASARALFVGAAASAKAAGQTDREQVLRDRAQALEPRLTRLVIEVHGSERQLTIERNGVPLDESDWGRALAVDPDTYRIRASAPGKVSWTTTLKVDASAPVTTVEVPTLEASAAVEAKPAVHREAPALAPRTNAAAPRPTPTRDLERHRSLFPPLILGALGVGGLVGGAVMGLEYLSANGDAKSICPASRGCSQADVAVHERLLADARSARVWSYAGFGIGTFALAGAAAVYLLNSTGEHEDRLGFRTAPLLGAGSFGAVVERSF